ASNPTATPPTGRIPSTPEPPPANIAPMAAAPTRPAAARTPTPGTPADGAGAASMARHGTIASGVRPTRVAGYLAVPSNKSFTLHTRPDHLDTGDSYERSPGRAP